MQASSLRRGIAVVYQNQIYIVTEFTHRTPGNKRAFMQITLKSVKTGQIIQQRFSSSEEVEQAVLDSKKMQYLYNDSEGYHFMDMDDYQTHVIQSDLVGDTKYYLKENMEVEVMFYEGKPIEITLPKQVSLKVTDSPPGVRGDSVSNNTKVAVLETGLKVNVPIFIEEGTVVKVNTVTGEYLGRE